MWSRSSRFARLQYVLYGLGGGMLAPNISSPWVPVVVIVHASPSFLGELAWLLRTPCFYKRHDSQGKGVSSRHAVSVLAWRTEATKDFRLHYYKAYHTWIPCNVHPFVQNARRISSLGEKSSRFKRSSVDLCGS